MKKQNVSGITLFAITLETKMNKAEKQYNRLAKELDEIVCHIPKEEMGYYVKATTHK